MLACLSTRRSRLPSRLAFGILCFALLCPAVHAATPSLRDVMPRGVERGTQADIVLHGERLDDAREILFYDPSITVNSLKAVNGKEVDCHLTIAPDASLGEHQLRLRTATGISEIRTIYVVPFPIVQSVKPNNRFETPQPINLNVTVAGTIENEEVDYFRVNLKKGQRLTAEVFGMRLGGQLFDPYVAILDSRRFDLATSDDTALALQDPIASIIAPADGNYVIQIRESSYGGNGDCHYLMHVGTFPRPLAVYPLGGQIGTDLPVRFIGDLKGPIEQTVHLPQSPSPKINLFAEQDGLPAPSPNFVRASAFPNVLEVEPNDTPATATATTLPLPLAFNGVIDKPNDIDFFRFTAKGGQAIDVRVFARQLRSPLDSVLKVYNAKGNELASNDDSGGPDSYLRFTPPSDGDYLLSIRDQLHNGGSDYTYRVELTPVVPSLSLNIPEFAPNSQERQAIAVPKGNRFATLIRVTRTDCNGDVALDFPELPKGVSATCPAIAAENDLAPVVFEATADAAAGGSLCPVAARCTDSKQNILGHLDQNVVLIEGVNNTPFYVTRTDKLAVAVTDPAPFKLRIEPPKAPLVQDGQLNIKVVAERNPDFHGPIQVHMLFNPPGVSSSPEVDIPPEQTEINYPLSAAGDALPHHWKICVMGSTDTHGLIWASSQLADLEVGTSLVNAQLQTAAVERGKTIQIFATVEQRTKFDGTATVKLLGLPSGTTAEDIPLTCNDQRLAFTVHTTDQTPIGADSSLVCQITLPQNGDQIIQQSGQGGTLRVDPPTLTKPDRPTVAAAPTQSKSTNTATVPKVLSRLEQLRLQQEQN